MINQLSIATELGLGSRNYTKTDTTSTFSSNMSLPIHRWFRYSAGFSANWVKNLIEQEKKNGRYQIFDPFVGCGTVLLESQLCGVPARGVEAHPFVARIARAKLYWQENPKEFLNFALSILDEAKKLTGEIKKYPSLIMRCFTPQAICRLDSLRAAWIKNADGSPLSELTWLALASILRECSHVGTAQWQYVLPNKTKAKTLDPYEAFKLKVHLMSEDMANLQKMQIRSKVVLHQEDARSCSSIPDKSVDLIITSPPYANNYDYADATRLEMSFFGDVHGWGDLQEAVRKYLIRSCTQHVAKENIQLSVMLKEPGLDSIRDEITPVCKQLENERVKHGGKKPYHTMIAAYFADMAKVWGALRRITHKDSLICFVVGDSAPYGVYVPVDRWLGELAVNVGFKSYSFEKTRDRNIKWKNRKHRVPLHEGRLWVNG